MKTIAIVGRPNVGKSSLFNRICSKRISIVEDIEGVTRDRIYEESEVFGRNFRFIDTGGLDPFHTFSYSRLIEAQVNLALEEADGIIFVVDGQVGITKLDELLARQLLKLNKPIAVAVNKADNKDQEAFLYEFYGLGIEHMFPTSASHGTGLADLLEHLTKVIPEEEEVEVENSNQIKVAIIGRPNVGKSTLVNTLLNEERCMVADQAGTTRDSIDIEIQYNDRSYLLIDTAGIRKKKAETDVIEKYAAIRTERAIERADICLLMIDVNEGLSSQDKTILRKAEELGKGCVVFFNKWDTVSNVRMEHCEKYVRALAPFLQACPILFGSLKEGRNVDKILDSLAQVHDQLSYRVTTGQLNRFLERAMQKYHPPMINGKRLRIYYLTQVQTCPPKFVLFINDSKRMAPHYRKYLVNQFREEYPFGGVPLFFGLRPKEHQKNDPHLVMEREFTQLSDSEESKYVSITNGEI